MRFISFYVTYYSNKLPEMSYVKSVKHGPRGILSMVIVMLDSKEHIFYVNLSMASMKMEHMYIYIYIYENGAYVYI